MAPRRRRRFEAGPSLAVRTKQPASRAPATKVGARPSVPLVFAVASPSHADTKFTPYSGCGANQYVQSIDVHDDVSPNPRSWCCPPTRPTPTTPSSPTRCGIRCKAVVPQPV